MAIRESDSDDARQKIDDQDHLDAEEIMVNAMMDSVASSSQSSGVGVGVDVGGIGVVGAIRCAITPYAIPPYAIPPTRFRPAYLQNCLALS